MICKISSAQQYKLPQQLNDEQSKMGERRNRIDSTETKNNLHVDVYYYVSHGAHCSALAGLEHERPNPSAEHVTQGHLYFARTMLAAYEASKEGEELAKVLLERRVT